MQILRRLSIDSKLIILLLSKPLISNKLYITIFNLNFKIDKFPMKLSGLFFLDSY